MEGKNKTKDQLMDELRELRQRVVELEKSIAEQKQADEPLGQYEHIVSSSTDMMALLDKNFVYVAANKAYVGAFGKTREEIIGQTVSEVFGEEFFKTLIKPNAERCLAGEEVNYQAWFDFPAYEPRYMNINYYPYIGVGNRVTGFVVNGRNITERKRAEEALQESEQRFRSLVEQAADAFFVVDLKGRFLDVNQRASDSLGYTRDELLAMSVPDIDVDFSAKRVQEEVVSKLSPAKFITVEGVHRRKDGTTFPVEVCISLIESAGEPHSLSLARDISERKQAEKEIQRLNEQLEERVKERTAELEKELTKRKQAEEELEKREARVAQQNVLLDQKNIALREIIGQVKKEKERIEEQIQANVSQLLHPIFSKLKSNTLRFDEKVIDLLEDNLNHLTASFGSKISGKMYSLSQREVEICNMIKSGLSSKEIAGLLTISYRTVTTYRNKIRKKLGLINKEINLTSYLKTL